LIIPERWQAEGKLLLLIRRGGRNRFKMREVMNFGPSPTILHSQEEVVEYLEKYRGSLPSGIVVSGARLR